MGSGVSCLPSRPRHEDQARRPRKREDPQEEAAVILEPLPAPPPRLASLPAEPPLPGRDSRGALEVAPSEGQDPTLEVLQRHLEALKALQTHYLQGQLKIRRTCQHFPRSLRALSLQISRTRRRLVRAEVWIQRRGPDPGLPRSPAVSVQGSSGGASDQTPAAPAPLPLALLVPPPTGAPASGEGASITSCTSLPLHLFPPAPPSPPPLQPDLDGLREALGTFLELQAHHLQERKRDLRTCQGCLKAIKAVRGQLRGVRERLWQVEAQMGVQAPPREAEEAEAQVDQEKEEGEEEEEEGEREQEEPEASLSPARGGGGGGCDV